MKDHDGRDLPVHPLLYVKRPDLRVDELSETPSPDELATWQWWITGMQLFERELEGPIQERIGALDLSMYQHIHGTPDPAKILAFFCLCHEWRIYPPAWIMNELYTRLNEYLRDNVSGKKKSLGEYFGESVGGVRGPYFRQQAFKGVMQSAFVAIDRLRYSFNFSKEQALGIVSRRLEFVVNKTSFRFDKGEAALEKEYREWCKNVHCQEWLEQFENISLTDEENKEFLRSFPPDSFTGFPHIEKLLKD